MSYYSRKHRNPKGGEEQNASGPAVQRKKKSGAFFQAKLKVGKAGDVHEKEADAVANKVVRRLATSKEDEKLSTHDARMEKDKEEPMKPVQKKPMKEKDKDKDKKGVHKKDDPKKKKKKGAAGGAVQKKEMSTASEAVSMAIEERSGKGSPLAAKTLAEMNHQFGMDFSAVRIHTDSAAVALCRELNALAFTHGQDIFFNEGKFNPESDEGRRLLAHELTHVAQQQEGV